MIERIISGGQTGADQVALRAARKLGIPTGGHAPRGWKTLDGPAPWLADYGLIEHVGDYAARTEANVRDSGATIRVARVWNSPGELCTLRAITKHRRRWRDVVAVDGDFELRVKEVRDWLEYHSVRVLNVAGNSEKTMPGIGAFAEKFLLAVLSG